MFDDLIDSMSEDEILTLTDNMTSCHSLKYLTYPPLTDEQSIDVLKSLLVKRIAIMYSTGKGKTFIASAFMRALKNYKGGKFLYVCKKDQKLQTPKKISGITGLKCSFYTAEYDEGFGYSAIANCDVLMVTHEVFNSEYYYKILSQYRHLFTAVIVDEAHLISNLNEANGAYALFTFCYNFEYMMALTATPITTDLEQFAKLMRIVSPKVVFDYTLLASELKNHGTTFLEQSMLDTFIVRTRGKSLRRGVLVNIPAMSHQKEVTGKDMFVITKGPGAYNQVEEVYKQVTSRVGQRGIIYSNLHVCQDFLVEYLKHKGLKVGLINGDTSMDEREILMNEFASGELRVIVTNITTAVDLECEYVVFYEFTPHVTQFIGRAERGVTPKQMDILFIVTENTGEFEYFYRNVYEISSDIQDLLEIDLSEITRFRRRRGLICQ